MVTQDDEDDNLDAELGQRETPNPGIGEGRFGWVPMRFLIPNMITLSALCAGVSSIRLGFDGRFELAVGLVIIAALLDALDGRVARMLKGTSKFGAEMDSLADFVNFGVAPAMLIYSWSLFEMRNLGWIVALCLAICCALRLARFNVALEDPNKPDWAVNFFTGIPAPAGALLAMLPIYLGLLAGLERGSSYDWAIAPYVVLVAAGMVSQIPTFSGKTIGKRVRREWALPIVGGGVLMIALLISYPWEMMSVFSIGYIAALPFSHTSYRKLAAREKAADKAKTAE